ncbi:hypothetical protein HPB51_001080 [Rhipicephalus microplus]|uniref:Kelch-like protein diablo n=1 Tax=Rhipicephalus microplus TaxID=6941 RepID=A0A9J6EF90_RHIMP|nr:hypothetical protein HPB51_001080 [Rhipicephalus microplus]
MNDIRCFRSTMGEILHTDLDSSASPARLEYTSEKHSRHTLEAINLLRLHRELCDVVLLVGNRKIFAHRIVLSACSPYFHAMFTGELAESRQTEVTIRDIDEHAMELLMDFAYTSHIVVEEGNVQMLLPAACLLQMAKFKMSAVMESEEFLLLPVNQLVDIISSDELNVRSEEQVFSAVMSWVKYNVTERRQNLGQVLQHVRLPLLSPKFLVGTVGSDLLIKSDEVCRDLVDEAKNYLLLPQERPLMQGPRTRPRKPVRRGEVLFAVGGWCSGDAIASVERYDPQANEWRMVAPMSKRRCGVGVAVLNDLLYAVGGHDGQSYLNSIERYDPQTNQWSSDVAPTSSCRTSVGVAVLDGYLYAVGGQDGVSCLNFVERYDPQTNRWAKVAPMSTKRLGVAVAVLGSYLYAMGGSDGTSPLNTDAIYQQQFDLEEERAKAEDKLSECSFAAATERKRAFVVDGANEAARPPDGTTFTILDLERQILIELQIVRDDREFGLVMQSRFVCSTCGKIASLWSSPRVRSD